MAQDNGGSNIIRFPLRRVVGSSPAKGDDPGDFRYLLKGLPGVRVVANSPDDDEWTEQKRLDAAEAVEERLNQLAVPTITTDELDKVKEYPTLQIDLHFYPLLNGRVLQVSRATLFQMIYLANRAKRRLPSKTRVLSPTWHEGNLRTYRLDSGDSWEPIKQLVNSFAELFTAANP